MKFTLVTETYAPEMNGVAMTLERLVGEFVDRGHDVTVVRPKQHKDDGSTEAGRLRHLTVAGLPLPGYQGLRFGLPSILRLRSAWLKDRPDIVHVATEGPLGVGAVLAAKQLGIPVVSSFHTNFHAYGEHYRFGFLQRAAISYLRFFHNHTLATFCPSEDLIDSLDDLGFQNLKRLGRGVDTDLYSPDKRDVDLREEWGVGAQDLVAIHVGRLAKEKNIPLVLEAYRAAQQTLPSLKMILVGDGPERANLEQAYPDVHFAGLRRGEDLARYYASGDLFLFGSVTETFGNVVTEAMASGLLVVAYDYAAPKQYMRSHENGRLVPFDDADAFVEAVLEVTADTCRHAVMREAARATVLGVSWSSIIGRFESEVLNQIVAVRGDAEPTEEALSSGMRNEQSC